MDPITAVLIAVWASGYFTRNVVQDLVYKSRGEDPPSYRREQARRERRAAKAASGRHEAKKFWSDAWNDAWASAGDKRARKADKAAQRRREAWRAEDEVEAAEAEAHERNRRRDRAEDQAHDRNPRTCEVCGRATVEDTLQARHHQGGFALACPGCAAELDRLAEQLRQTEQAQQAERERAERERWPRCAHCRRPTSAPQQVTHNGQPIQLCRTCLRAHHVPPPIPDSQPGQDQPGQTDKADKADKAEQAEAAAPDRKETETGQNTQTDKTDKTERDQADQDSETGGAKVIQFSAWRRPTTPASSPQTNTNDGGSMSAESTTLSAAIAFSEGMGQQAEQAVSEVELSISGLTTGGTSGPAIDSLNTAMESFQLAAAALRAAHAKLSEHLSVREAYEATQGAGTREYVTQD